MMNQGKNNFVQRLKSIIDTAIDGIITIDDKGIIESINPSAADLFGYKESEVIGRNIKMLMPTPYRDEHDGYINRYQKTRNPHIIGRGREVHGKTKAGKVFPMRLAVSEVILNNRVIYTGIIHDLTDVTNAELQIKILNRDLEFRIEERTKDLEEAVNELMEISEKLKRSKEDLKLSLEKEKELNELKSRFVSMASHEFRTPLTTIMSSATLITKYPDTEHQANREKHVERIKSAVGNLTGILNDFLSLSVLEEGAVKIFFTSFNVKDLIEEVVKDLKGFNKKNQEIEYNLKGEDGFILTDRRILKNILFNILSNAIKYSESAIRCEFIQETNQLELSISDRGIGIPEEDQKYLFTRFFRASNAINFQGTGLGLNIVRRYISLLKGDITFKSTEDKGTTFTVTIPINT